MKNLATIVRCGVLGAVLPLLVLSMGCGSSQDPPSSRSGLRASGLTFDALTLTAGQKSEASAQNLSGFQTGLLSDDTLSFDEYEQAVFGEVSCLVEHGFETYGVPLPGRQPGPEPTLSRRGNYEYISRKTNTPEHEVEKEREECENEYGSFVRRLWEDHVRPTESELQQARDAIAACLTESGIAVSVHPGARELLLLAFPPDGKPSGSPEARYLQCARKVQVEFELPGFMG